MLQFERTKQGLRDSGQTIVTVSREFLSAGNFLHLDFLGGLGANTFHAHPSSSAPIIIIIGEKRVDRLVAKGVITVVVVMDVVVLNVAGVWTSSGITHFPIGITTAVAIFVIPHFQRHRSIV